MEVACIEIAKIFSYCLAWNLLQQRCSIVKNASSSNLERSNLISARLEAFALLDVTALGKNNARNLHTSLQRSMRRSYDPNGTYSKVVNLIFERLKTFSAQKKYASCVRYSALVLRRKRENKMQVLERTKLWKRGPSMGNN